MIKIWKFSKLNSRSKLTDASTKRSPIKMANQPLGKEAWLSNQRWNNLSKDISSNPRQNQRKERKEREPKNPRNQRRSLITSLPEQVSDIWVNIISFSLLSSLTVISRNMTSKLCQVFRLLRRMKLNLSLQAFWIASLKILARSQN